MFTEKAEKNEFICCMILSDGGVIRNVYYLNVHKLVR